MDVDEGQGDSTNNASNNRNAEAGATAIDDNLEQSLLQQFSCLGTTDHDELVSQLQKILGNQLNYNTARFFLDMNNWNLQAAVGCYFDFNCGQKLPSMQIMHEITAGEVETVAPNASFYKAWRVINNSEEVWPYGCYLKCTSNPLYESIPLNAMAGAEECLLPGGITVLTINLVSPFELGPFQTKWRLSLANGTLFGDTIWSIVNVVSDDGTIGIIERLSALQTSNSSASTQTQTIEQQQNYEVSLPPPPPPPPSSSSTHQTDDNEMS